MATTIFCTWHDNCTFMASVKFSCDVVARNWITKRSLNQEQKCLMKWASDLPCIDNYHLTTVLSDNCLLPSYSSRCLQAPPGAKSYFVPTRLTRTVPLHHRTRFEYYFSVHNYVITWIFLLTLCEGMHSSPLDSLHKEPVMSSLCDFTTMPCKAHTHPINWHPPIMYQCFKCIDSLSIFDVHIQ